MRENRVETEVTRVDTVASGPVFRTRRRLRLKYSKATWYRASRTKKWGGCTDLDSVDLLDLNMFVEEREYAVFRELRDKAPVYFHPESEGAGFHAVTRCDDIVNVVREPLLFSSASGTQIKNRRAESHEATGVHNSDAPYHIHLRNLVLARFQPSALRVLTSKVKATVDHLLDECPRGEAFDFVDSCAVKLPMLVIGHMLGVPDADQPSMVNWANTISDVRATVKLHDAARHELFNFFRRLVALKRAEPAGDLATALAKSRIEGRPLNESELDAYFTMLAAAGNETTRFLVSCGLEQLCGQPDDLDMLRKSPDLVPGAIEEMLRYVTPVMQIRRTASDNTEIAGVSIKKGDKVVVYFALGNRDERKYSDPEAFKPKRKEAPHIGFGNGAHFCPGAHLARLEAKIFFESLLERVSDIRLAGNDERLPS